MLQKSQENKSVILLKNLILAEDPRASAVGKRICPTKPETSVKPWWNLGELAQDGSVTGTREKPWWNLGSPLPEPWRNAGGSFRGTFLLAKTDLAQRTRENAKANLLRNLYYCWRPQSWGKTTLNNPDYFLINFFRIETAPLVPGPNVRPVGI